MKKPNDTVAEVSRRKEEKIKTPNTHIYDLSFIWLDTGTSTAKTVGVILISTISLIQNKLTFICEDIISGLGLAHHGGYFDCRTLKGR